MSRIVLGMRPGRRPVWQSITFGFVTALLAANLFHKLHPSAPAPLAVAGALAIYLPAVTAFVWITTKRQRPEEP